MLPIVRLLALVWAIALGWSAPAAAQQEAVAPPDYATWESVARRAEAAVDAGTDTNAVFTTLRGRIAGFRASFEAAQSTNSERIETIKAQITALGPAPAEGETETPDIAARRAQLNAQLKELQAPGQAAQEAFTRAEGLIGEIDSILRGRQTERLLALGPTPLNPVLWPEALEALGQSFSDVWGERRVFSNSSLMSEARANLPIVLLLLAISAVLLTRGRRWAAWGGEQLRKLGGRGRGVWGFVISLLRIILPLAGVYIFTEALFATGLVGLRGTAILEALPFWGALFLSFRWLAERLFSRNDEDAIFSLPAERRTEARYYMTTIAIVYVVGEFLRLLYDQSDFTEAGQAVLTFPLVAFAGMILFRFGQILRRQGVATQADDTQQQGAQSFSRIVRLLGRATQIVGVVAPILSGIGYATAGAALLDPWVLTMGLFGLVLVLQRFTADLYGWVMRRSAEEARDSLVAMLLTFLLLLAAVPVLALIWGARVTDLYDLWTKFLRGFTIGETTISPTNFVIFAVVFLVGYSLTRLLQSTLKTSVLPKTRIDLGGQTAVVSGVGYVGIFLSGLIAITTAGIDLSSVALVAGALSVGIGFGLQNIVSNFVSGIILLIERPISEGDWIEVGGQHGYVKNISVRSTRIETFDRSDVIVPNADLVSGTVTNYTRGNTVGRVIIPVGVAYGTDTRKVEALLREVAESHPMVLMNPKPSVVFQSFGASSLDFEIRAILRDVNWMLTVKSEMNHKIAERFAEEGIEIPFPQQDVWLRNPETLPGGGPTG